MSDEASTYVHEVAAFIVNDPVTLVEVQALVPAVTVIELGNVILTEPVDFTGFLGVMVNV